MRVTKKLAAVLLLVITTSLPLATSISTNPQVVDSPVVTQTEGYTLFAHLSGDNDRMTAAIAVDTIISVGAAAGLLCGVQAVAGAAFAG